MMNLNRKIYMILAFNMAGLLAMISVFTMQPPSEPRRQAQRESDGLEPTKWQNWDSESMKKSKHSVMYSNEERATYSFPLYGVMPLVTCANFTGSQFDQPQRRQLIDEAASNVKTSILFSFSPLVDDHVRRMFASNVLAEPWFEVHPFQVACLPDSDHGLYCALRVWLRMDRFQGNAMRNFRNRFQDSFMYVLRLDRNLNYVPGSGDLLGIPTPIQDIAFTGPEDPRLFSVNGSTYINFVMAHTYENVKFAVRRQFLWNIDNNVLFDIHVNKFVLNELEKNWTPWVANETLHFVYQFTPVLRVMRCKIQPPPMRSAECSFICGQPKYGAVVSTAAMLLRGGTPISQYTVANYYIAVTHSVQAYAGVRLYAAQLLLLNGLSMRIVLVSSPVFIDLDTMKRIENLAGSTVRLPFIYARSVIVENADSLIVAVGVNDNLCFLVRLEGVAKLLGEAIEQDKRLSAISKVLSCHSQETEQQRENWLAQVYNQMNDWLLNKNVLENERRFSSTPNPHFNRQKHANGATSNF